MADLVQNTLCGGILVGDQHIKVRQLGKVGKGDLADLAGVSKKDPLSGLANHLLQDKITHKIEGADTIQIQCVRTHDQLVYRVLAQLGLGHRYVQAHQGQRR